MKKLKYVIMALAIPLIIGGTFVFGLNKYLEKKDADMLKTKDLYPLLHDTKSVIKDKGVYANSILAKDGSILIMGSSDLSHSTRQHPDLYFNTGRTKYGAIAIGRAYTQTLQHASVVGSLSNDVKNKKVVLLLSMQWFMDKEGVTPNHFQTRFSPVQFYDLLNNDKISEKTKKIYAKRVSSLMEKPGEYRAEALYAKLYTDNSIKGKIIKLLLKPYYMARKSMVSLKDKGILYQKLSMLYDKKQQNHNINGKIDWEKEKQMALVDAKTRVGRRANKFGGKTIYVDKGYYREYILKKERYFKDFYSYVKVTDSKEYADFKIFLDVCKDLGVKPTIVVVPGLPLFYDYTGMKKSEREAYYNKVKNIIKPYGFNIIDLSDKENTRYYLRDIMHIGTLGWVDLCQRINNIYER